MEVGQAVERQPTTLHDGIFHRLSHSIMNLTLKVGFIPISQMRKLRQREVK